MLENKYGEYEALENQRILMERMNVETQEEIDAIIKQDMEDFVAYTDSKMDESINNYYEFYTEFNSWFDDFFESYTDNLAELAKLNEQFLSLLNVEDYLNGNEMNISGGLATLGSLSPADREAIYAKVDLGEDYSSRMEEAIRDEQYDLAQEYALLREAKADIKRITLGQGNYRTNQQVWDDAMKEYRKTYSEEVNNKINDVQNDVKIGNDYSRINNDYASQNLNATNKSNTILQNQTTQLSNGLTDVQVSIIEQAGYTVEAIEKLSKELSISIETIVNSIEKEESINSNNSIKYNGTSNYGFGDAEYSSDDSSINLNENYTALANEALERGDKEAAKKYAEKANQKTQSSDYTGSIDKVVYNEKTGKYEGVKKKGYSSGLRRGPVTYTGLAMLHGTPQEPEYVLNNDQAYNLLYNLSVARNAKMAEFDSIKESNGVQYIVQGDIVLEGVDDPSKFWQEVTTAMGNRWNVTKHK